MNTQLIINVDSNEELTVDEVNSALLFSKARLEGYHADYPDTFDKKGVAISIKLHKINNEEVK